MEVHHHPHGEKKNFKEYFLEFVMIFPAVSLGFFAENLRERIGDNGRERQYMQSFNEDLSILQKYFFSNLQLRTRSIKCQ